MKPLISIVIPTYNRAHDLGRALRSVVAQTYSNWEAINLSLRTEADLSNEIDDLLLKCHKWFGTRESV